MNKLETEKFCVEVEEHSVMRKYYAFHVEKYYKWAIEKRKQGDMKKAKYYFNRMKENYLEFLKKDTAYTELSYIGTCIFNISLLKAYNICKNSKKISYLTNTFSTPANYKISYKFFSIVGTIMKGGK